MAETKKKGWTTRDVIIAIALVAVVGGVFGVRAFYAPYRIPSGSMMPTVVAGDYVLAANVRRSNGAPVVHVGDVVFHEQTDEPGRKFIRRVIALPGQRIAFRDGVPVVDGVAAVQAPTDQTGPDGERIMRETLAGRSYLVAYRTDDRALDLRNMSERVVPEGQVFLVGDARDNSADSRFRGAQPLSSIQQVGGWIIYSPEAGRAGHRIE